MSDTNGTKKSNDNHNIKTIKQVRNNKEDLIPTDSDPIIACEALRQQNDALRQELHDIRREMDEITDQFRTEDAEEFKQLQAELEVAAKNCRILQFKLRKSEKRNENLENEKNILEDKIQQIIRDNTRVRELDDELLIAKEVSVRLHNELEKSEESRLITEKLNLSLKQHLDTMKEVLDEKLSKSTHDDYHAWQLSIYLYESLFREYFLMEELSWLNSKNFNPKSSSTTNLDENKFSNLMSSYQQKISSLNDEINNLKQDIIDRDKELSQIRIQYKILKQRSQSVEQNSTSSEENINRLKRGVSVESGGNLREQLEASNDEIRLLKNKLLRLEDELNSTILEKENLLSKLDEQSKPNLNDQDLQNLIKKIEHLTNIIKDNKIDEKIVTYIQQLLRSSRWNKPLSGEQLQTQLNLSKSTDQTNLILQQANELKSLLESKHDVFKKIHSHLANLSYDTNDTSNLLAELDTLKKNYDDKQQLYQHTVENLQLSSNKIVNLEKILEQQKTINNELQQENTRLSLLNAKQLQDLKHLEQLRQSIMTFEKKLDQKQTRVNELSMKIIEKEDIIETKVKECQKHRLELRELETKYYTLGKQLEEQILAMTKEIEKLNIEKEMLRFDLESIRLTQQNDRPISARSNAEDEFHRVKFECEKQILDGEIESYKLRLNQMNSEKEDLLKTIKDMEKKSKDLHVKYDASEQSWIRLKTEMAEKQRKFDESIKLKSELQNAVDRLRQKLHDVEMHSQDKQNKFAVEKQQWEKDRLEFIGKINEFEEQLSKVTKRQRKDLETTWKKERTDLQKQLQQSQQLLKDLQKQIAHREIPSHLTEKINILMTENELLLNKIKELETIVDDVHLLKNEIQRLREKNSSDWSYWRKQQSDIYAQLRQQQFLKESILNKFDRLQKQINGHQRDFSLEPISLNSYHIDPITKTSFSNLSTTSINIDEFIIPIIQHDKQDVFKRTQIAEDNTAASLEEITLKIDRVEDSLFSYRRFMDFIRAKSERGSSVTRDENMSTQNSTLSNSKRLASAPPENANQSSQRRSRLDTTTDDTHERLPSADHENQARDLLSTSTISPATGSKNRFFSLSRRFRFRTQSPEKPSSTATVHFLDEDIDLETKEPTNKKSEKPSKGILKTLRHRSPFRFRSKDAVIIEKETPPVPAPSSQPSTLAVPPSKSKQKTTTTTMTKPRGRLVELKKTTPNKTVNSTPKKLVNVTPITDPSNASLTGRASGLKDLIHKFELTPPKPKRVSLENLTLSEDQTSIDEQQKILTIDIPDLLQNVEKDPTVTTTTPSTKPTLKHSNSNRRTGSFESAASMLSVSESVTTTGSNTRKPTSTARPLMLSVSKEESP